MASETINLGGGDSVEVTYDRVTISVEDSTPGFFVRYTYLDRFGNEQTGKLRGTAPGANAMRAQIRNAIGAALKADLES